MDNATNLQQNGQPNEQPAIIRTGRGLTIAGTRTTLYRIMDYVKAGWPPKLIRDRLNLTNQQVAAALAYIDRHREEVEAGYQQVLAESEEMKREWEEKRREIEEAEIRAKLVGAKARLGTE